MPAPAILKRLVIATAERVTSRGPPCRAANSSSRGLGTANPPRSPQDGERPSELVGLNIEQLEFACHDAPGASMPGGLRVFVARSKEDQLGKGTFVDIPRGDNERTCPVRALHAWIERVGRPAGPLFRVVRGAVVEHERMHVGAVSRAVQRACARVGLVGDYSTHSLPSGLATSALLAGTSTTAIHRHGRWLDRRSVERYLRAAPVYEAQNPARGLL